MFNGHKTVNHRRLLKDPVTEDHTNTSEGICAPLKNTHLITGKRTKNFVRPFNCNGRKNYELMGLIDCI